MSKKQKVLLVLGASSDMGRELIIRVQNQYKVILCHYHTSRVIIDELKEQCQCEIIGYQADFNEVDSVLRFIDQMHLDGYEPDHIVHFPAVKIQPHKFVKEEWNTYEEMIRVSLRSIVMILKACIPSMARQKYGKILLMLTSYVEGVPPKYLAPYITSKYALLGLMKSLAVEYADKGITVNGISPEMTETKFLSEMSEYIITENALKSPRKRNLSTKEVAPAMEFLLSDGSDSITGHNIVVTGGK